MPRDLLLEIGTEELPASFVTGALRAMPELATKLLADARLAHGAMHAWGTPRRLTLHVAGVAEAQPDLSEEMTGPPRSVALDASGKPTKAGEAFARKHGKGPEALTVVTTAKGEYVAVRREEKGEPAAKVLPRIVEALAAKIPFPKSMRWGAGEVAFGRPIHWLVVLWGSDVLAATVAGVAAGRATRGHRFLAPQPFDLRDAGGYLDALRAAHVVADPDERRRVMREGLHAAAKTLGGELIEDAFLEGECASLVEEPHVVPGSFDPQHLDLPEDVIVSVMRHHQRYFAVRDPGTQRLLPRYLNVVNTARDPETIAKGNDRVLRARLADARFFVTEDSKTPLGDRFEKLRGVVFQAKLGTIAEKVERIQALALSLPHRSDDTEVVIAAQLAKCDLVTLIVGEFPELQGAMGRWFALQQGIIPEVADAIRDHYLPKGAGDAAPKHPIAAALGHRDRSW